jgi:hypothetical protein
LCPRFTMRVYPACAPSRRCVAVARGRSSQLWVRKPPQRVAYDLLHRPA